MPKVKITYFREDYGEERPDFYAFHEVDLYKVREIKELSEIELLDCEEDSPEAAQIKREIEDCDRAIERLENGEEVAVANSGLEVYFAEVEVFYEKCPACGTQYDESICPTCSSKFDHLRDAEYMQPDDKAAEVEGLFTNPPGLPYEAVVDRISALVGRKILDHEVELNQDGLIEEARTGNHPTLKEVLGLIPERKRILIAPQANIEEIKQQLDDLDGEILTVEKVDPDVIHDLVEAEIEKRDREDGVDDSISFRVIKAMFPHARSRK